MLGFVELRRRVATVQWLLVAGHSLLVLNFFRLSTDFQEQRCNCGLDRRALRVNLQPWAEKRPGESGTTEKGPLYTWEILESSRFTPRASGGFSRNVMMVHYNFSPHLLRCDDAVNRTASACATLALPSRSAVAV